VLETGIIGCVGGNELIEEIHSFLGVLK